MPRSWPVVRALSSARAIIEAEDPKGVFKQITAIPRYTVQPLAGRSDICDFFIEDNVWLGRAKHVSRREYPQISYWQVTWMPEHPAHIQPERFKNADEAAQWMLHHRKFTRESEDPKATFRQAVSVPKPPPALLRQAVAAKEEYLGKSCEWTSVSTNPKGETFCYGGFTRGTNEVVAALLFFDRHVRQWVLVDQGTFAEAEDPKNVLRQAGRTIEGLLKGARFELTANHPNSQTWIRVARGLGHWKVMVEKGQDGTEYWMVSLVKPDGSLYGNSYDGNGFWGLKSRLRYLALTEAEDPKAIMRAAREPDEQVRGILRRAQFEQKSKSDRYESWERSTLPGTAGTTAQMVRFLWNGQHVWDYTVYNHNQVAWTTSAMTPERAVAFIKRHYFHHKTGELFQ